MSDPSARPTLNPQQARVVARTVGDTFVTAGAGSGKTRVIAERFVEIVLAAGDDEACADALRRVLVITFTDKAAGELAERVRRVLLERGRPDLARLVDEAWISTIHGFCARIVRRHALEIGVDPGFDMLADPRTGVVREQSFESVATELMRSDAGVADLIDAHGVAGVREAVARGLDTVRSMGRPVDDLRAARPADCAAALRSGLAQLPGIAEDYRDLKPLAVVKANAPQIAGLLARLESLDSRSPELAAELVALARDFKLTKPGGAGEPVRSVTNDAIGVLDDLVRAGTETLASHDAEAFARLIRAYSAEYESRKRTLGALDFEDLQLLVTDLFEKRPEVAARYAKRFLAVMVDEFQDTNDLQMRVIVPVAAGGLCVVGDEKQSIYGFRHADVDIFHGRAETQRAADPDGYCPLQTNYRTHPDLLETLNAMFARPPFFGAEYLELLPGRDSGWRVEVPEDRLRAEVMLVDRVGWEDVHWRVAEARLVARRISELVESGVNPGDIVVLMRQMTTAAPFVTALRDRGIDVYAEASGGFFAAPEVADVRALLAVLANPRDGEALVALLAGGFGGVSDDALYRLTRREAATPPEGVWGALLRAEALGVGAEDEERCRLVRETIRRLRSETGRMRLADAILEAGAVLGEGGGCFARRGARANVRKLARIAEEFERVSHGDATAFLEHLAEREAFTAREAAAPIAGEGREAVRVMTVHAAKGLEFPVVVVADLGHDQVRGTANLTIAKDADGPFCAARLTKERGENLPVPGEFARAAEREDERGLREAKRVLYVACTRAEELLILSGGAKLDGPPGESLAIDWVRAAAGAAGSELLPGVAVSEFTAAEHGELVSDAQALRLLAPRSVLLVGPLPPEPPSGPRASRDAVVPPAELSYTALALYERCPFRFFAERVLGVGTLELSDPEGGPRGLGLAVHAALQLSALGSTPDAGRLAALARYHRLDGAAAARLAAAVEAYRGSPTARVMDGLGAAPEVRFAVGVGGGTLVGTIDLLARDGDRAVVADYKTGASELDAADARTRFSQQADVYALALLRSGSTEVEVRFVEVERDGRETVFTYAADAAPRLEAEVSAVFERIASADFHHLVSFDHDTCSDCPVSGSLCPVVRPRTKGKPRG